MSCSAQIPMVPGVMNVSPAKKTQHTHRKACTSADESVSVSALLSYTHAHTHTRTHAHTHTHALHIAETWLQGYILSVVILAPLFSSRISPPLKGTLLIRTQTMSFNLIQCQSSPQTLNFDILKDFSYVNKELGWKNLFSKDFQRCWPEKTK